MTRKQLLTWLNMMHLNFSIFSISDETFQFIFFTQFLVSCPFEYFPSEELTDQPQHKNDKYVKTRIENGVSILYQPLD